MQQLTESQVVCPHCWHHFYRDHAWHISQHPELRTDPVLGDGQFLRVSPRDAKCDRSGNVTDSLGMQMVERACPVCHKQVPAALLDRRPTFLSLVGAPSSGKTYFLASLIHGLRDEVSRELALAFDDGDNHDVRSFMEYERRLFQAVDPAAPALLDKTAEWGDLYTVALIDGVEVQLPKPFIFSLKPTPRHPKFSEALKRGGQSFVLYDNSGESFERLKDVDGGSRVTQHLAESDALLFAYDPLQDSEARRRFAGFSEDPQLTSATVTSRQETFLSEVAARIRRRRRDIKRNQRIPIPLCVCLLKYDVWKAGLHFIETDTGRMARPDEGPNGCFLRPLVRFRQQGISAMDNSRVNGMSWVLRGLLSELNPAFVSLAEAEFTTVRYFAVSALGTSPQFDEPRVPVAGPNQLLKVRPRDVKPENVTIPVIWIMRRLTSDIVYTTKIKNIATYSRKFASAQIKDVDTERIRVIAPHSKRMLVLDREYAGSAIEDPGTGEVIWIPEVSNAQDSNSFARQGRSASSQPPHAANDLSLDRKGTVKRGWFRR